MEIHRPHMPGENFVAIPLLAAKGLMHAVTDTLSSSRRAEQLMAQDRRHADPNIIRIVTTYDDA